MKICNVCNNKFRVLDKLKSLNKNNGEIQCKNCETKYKQNILQRKVSRSFGIAIAILSANGIRVELQDVINNKLLILIITGLITAFIIYIFMLITQTFIGYEKIE